MPAILELINPDGISYIAIAQHWAQGRFTDAINAYWSPCFSLAMVPWLLFGVPPLLAAKLILLIAGAALVFGAWTLLGLVTTDSPVRGVTTLLMALLAFEWSLAVVTPDLIMVAIFVWYLVALDRLRRSGSARASIACGLLGSLLYLTKALGLPLFLAHFTLSTARPATIRRWRTGVATCVVAILPWIALMASKYGMLTLGTAGAQNWRLMGPATRRFFPFWADLFAPPNPSATSIWEDPSSVAMPAWTALGSPAHLLDLVVRHGRGLLETLWARSPYVPIVAIVVVALVISSRDLRARPAAVVRDALLGMALVAAASLPFNIEERYLWTIPALALVLMAYVVDRVAMQWPDAGPVAIAAVVASIVLPSVAAIEAQHGAAVDMQRYVRAAAAIPTDLRGSRTATNPFSLETGGAPWTSWNDGLYVSWLAGLRFYGVVPPRADAATIERALDASGIDTFLLVGPDPVPGYLRGFREIAPLPTLGARVFHRASG
jgi:hypothetical protein